MDRFDDLIFETRGAVARIVINRPERLNALRMTITDRALRAAFERIEGDDGIRVVILTGAGDRAFCTGWDMEAIDEPSLDQLEALIRTNLELFFKIWHLRQPVVAAINGYAVGTGSAMAMSCDLALAAENARLAEPEIRHGALSPFLLLPFLTHAKAVHETYYTGDALDAADLYRLGLVNRVVPLAELEEASWAYADRLAQVPPFALQMKKRSLRAAYDAMGFSTVVRQHSLADALVIGSGIPEQRRLLDILAKQGMRAFLDARDGPFKKPK
jgi:enoyl-CoA hydratase/carnithine racemase